MAVWIPRSRTIGYCLRNKVGLLGLVGCHESSNCFSTSTTTSPSFGYIRNQLGGSYGNPHGFLSNSATLFRLWRLESSRAETQLLDAQYVEDDDDINQVSITAAF